MIHDWIKSMFAPDGFVLWGFEIWQIVGLAVLIALAWIIGWIISAVLLAVFRKTLAKWGHAAEVAVPIRRAIRPLGLMLAFILTALFCRTLELPNDVHEATILVLRIVVILFGTLAAFRLSDLLTLRMRFAADATESQLDDALVPLADKAIKFVVILTGFVIALQTLGFNIAALLAGVSIGGLALAFAAQDTIKNVFGSAMIFIDRPFQIGDWIVFEGGEGVVEEIGFRSTRLRTPANSLITVPNGRLADMTLDNLGLRTFRRYREIISVPYDTPPDTMLTFMEGIREIIRQHPLTVNDADRMQVHFFKFEPSALSILMVMHFAVPTWPEELQAREEINLAVLRLAREMNISFAFPTQTVHIQSMPKGNA
ncbi:MAG: mechanosensitive ion channel family protein [Ignavibacteriae bacterium]|nr:MAG: mechanosensitive ion channel family protein [Ignavibacteriota bacterium]